MCAAADAAHSFAFTLDSAKRQQYAGRPIHLSTMVKTDVLVSLLVPNPIPGSGQYTVPAPRAPEVPQDDTVYVISDRLGSEVILTDSHANVIFNVDYKAYGSAVDVQSKIETTGYTGHYEDASTGLTYMQARYYDADLGRFLSMDPAGVRPGDVMSFARYTYADANPVNFVDPDGWQAVGVDPPKRADDHGGAGSSGGYIVQGYYWQERAGVSWSNTASARGGGVGGGAVRTEPTVSVTANVGAPAIPQPMNPPRVIVPPWWLTRASAVGLFFIDANGFHDWLYGQQGCYGALACPGTSAPYYPGSYANEEAPSYPDNPDVAEDKYTKITGTKAKVNKEDGSVWEPNLGNGHGGEQWKRWPNRKSWERRDPPSSIWPDGRIRK